jgi:hypothetical protein
MIPDIALMLAAYMVPRLLRDKFPRDPNSVGEGPLSDWVGSLHIVAILVIVYSALHVQNIAEDLAKQTQASAQGLEDLRGSREQP